jgi:hypothetical protein
MPTINIESVSLTVIATGVIILFFKSFFNEKGKNAATKQDIEEITRKIETIKTEFIKETEKLKHELQFANQMKVSFSTDLKDAVVNAYESFNLWIEYVYDAHINSLDATTKQLKESEAEINNLYSKFVAAGAKLDLYYPDNEITKVMEKLLVDSIDFQRFVEEHLIEMEPLIEDLDEIEDLPDNEYDEKEFDTAHKKLMDEYNKSHKEMVRLYAKISYTQEEFRNRCHSILTQHIV